MKRLFTASVSLFVLFINIGIASAEPFNYNLDIQPNVLEMAYDSVGKSFIVSWGIDGIYFDGENQKKSTERFMEAILTYPDNWQKAGLQFVNSQNKADSLIWIRFYKSNFALQEVCLEDKALACAQLVYIVDSGYRCYIHMPYPDIVIIKFGNSEISIIRNFFLFAFILSHETGHCLGLPHMGENGDLMHKRISSQLKTFTFPNATEINGVKFYMNYIEMRFKDRYIYIPYQ